MHDIFQDLEIWFQKKMPIGLATVINTWGSSPRGVGAKMAFNLEAGISGSVSGGCVETAVVEAGLQAVITDRPELLNFGVADETAFEVGLACGGNIEIFVRKLDPVIYKAIRAAVNANIPAALVTVIAGPVHLYGREILIDGSGNTHGEIGEGLDEKALEFACHSMETDQSQNITLELQGHDTVRLFVDVITPPPVLVMVGGVHIAITLATLAKALGYHTIVIDPRRVFGSPDRFPHVDRLIQAWPDEAFAEIALTRNTCVALLTHDPKIDDPALKTVLNSPVFYIGALGSRKTNQKRRQRLLEAGITPAQLDRLYAPIGLDLGGKTPEEVALSIMAEILTVRRGCLR